MSRKTIAEKALPRIKHDDTYTVYRDACGRHTIMVTVCGLPAVYEERAGRNKYQFTDGSAILEDSSTGRSGLAFTGCGCFCLKESGHHDSCEYA